MATTNPAPEPRTLVLCFDGTADSYDDTNTNIVRLFALLEKDDPDKQLVYYQPGLGTYVSETAIMSPTMRKTALLLDQGVAWYLDAHIMGGYTFLMENYRPGDKISLFGFSRGAYTARCLAGMLHKVGLLPKSNKEQIHFAYERYVDRGPNGKHRSAGFKKTFSKEVEIDFIGVWDTVSSVGIFYTRHLPFSSSNTIVKTFRHALALDERRAKFNANVWHRNAPDEKACRHDPEAGSAIQPKKGEHGVREAVSKVLRTVSDEVRTWTMTSEGAADENELDEDDKHRHSIDEHGKKAAEAYDTVHKHQETDIKEVWFAGCHADVGGGSLRNSEVNSLAGPSLRWMINEILDLTSINLKSQLLFEMGIDVRVPSEARRDRFLPTPGSSRFTKASARKDRASETTAVGGSTLPPRTIEEIKKDLRLADVQNTDADCQGITNNPQSPLGDSPRPTKAVFDDTPQTAVTALSSSPTSPTTAGLARAHFAEPTSSSIRTAVEEHEYKDACSRIIDQLKERKTWWILEILPMRRNYQDEDGRWHKSFRPNLGRGRVIHQRSPLFHSSVLTRQDAEGYVPAAKFRGDPIYVD